MISPLMPVYRRSDIQMVRGEGCYLFDENGRRYLDFATGIAVNALGHCHPHLVAALKQQADTLWHCSNLYRIPQAEELASRLVEATFADSIFFCSSGAEAVECGIKILRRFHHAAANPQRQRIIVFEGGFHGRTMAGISAGGNEHAREGYQPLLPGFDRVAFNDLAAVERAVTPETAGILLEPVQGEGGVRVAAPAFLRGVRQLCDRQGLLLMLDEVQCGMGRTGTLFAHETAGIAPDVMAAAKGIGGGFPLAACLATARAAACMTPGSHGSTYGANPLAMAVGNAVMDIIYDKKFMLNVREIGKILQESLEAISTRFPARIETVRGTGLMLGLKTRGAPYALADALRANGLLTAPTAGDAVIRILPPLIITQAEVDEAAMILEQTLAEGN
ncbi:MAG: aspartate aminotransferase family protein [Alphaproteobacteria bacterium]|nr:aspartate aminotransferase family protein [Alphaproteobacteria bacterium]